MGCCDQPSTVVTINVGDLVAALTGMEQRIMARIDDVVAKIAQVQAGQTELAKDIRRLIADGDVTAALNSLDNLIAANEALDAEVEAASPEPTPEPTPEPAP